MRDYPRLRCVDIPGVHGAAGKTDLPVLLPLAEQPASGPFRMPLLHPKPWHGMVLVALMVASFGVSEVYSASQAAAKPGVFATFIRWIPFVMTGFMMNLVISFLAMVIGTVAGAALGLMLVSIVPPVRAGAWATTQFFRNSPWLVLLFMIMLLMPFKITFGEVEILIPDWLKATIGFSLPVMANIAEIVRGAVQSIPTAQWESAESLAFTRRQTMWMIILPQCIKRMIPPWMNWYAILTMATPICSIMGVEEAVRFSQQAMEAEGARPELLAPFYSFLLFIFFAYCYPIARWTIRLERKFTVKI